MKKWGNTFIIWALILIVGPFFGITLKGMGDLYYFEGLKLAIPLLIIGLIMRACSKEENKDIVSSNNK